MTRRSAILGYVVMIVLLSAGAAQSLAGSNTVYGDDIVNETITTADVRNEALIGADIRNGTLSAADLAANSVGGSEIANGAVTGADIGDNSVTGDDVDESTLELPNTSAFSKSVTVTCEKDNGAACTPSVVLSMPSPGALLVRTQRTDDTGGIYLVHPKIDQYSDDSDSHWVIVEAGEHTVSGVVQAISSCAPSPEPTPCDGMITATVEVVAIPAPAAD